MANRGDYDPSTYWLAPARNFRTSARLHLQHLLCQNTLGYILQPHVHNSVAQSITTSDTTKLKIADLACGNGVWLLDLNRELSGKGIPAQLDGYDINPINFPSPAFLPNSVTLNELDILPKPLPNEVVGAYDLVHIRALASIIVNENTRPLLSTALIMLKPGGWIQWEEMQPDFLISTPSATTPKDACEAIAQIVKMGGESRGLRFGFVAELDRRLKDNGFDDVHMEVSKNRKEDYKAWTDDFLMVWEELEQYFPSKVDQPQAVITKEMWAHMFSKAVSETEQGVSLHQGGIITAVGRKAL